MDADEGIITYQVDQMILAKYTVKTFIFLMKILHCLEPYKFLAAGIQGVWHVGNNWID